MIEEYLLLEKHSLSVYSFANLYLWKNSYTILWNILEESLCIFFQDKSGIFLYLPPLGKKQKPETIERLFVWMGRQNQKYPGVSRIENLEEKDVPFYQSLGYECIEKPGDYLCFTSDMAKLSGRSLKSKRGACNFFLKHYKNFQYRFYDEKDKDACLSLHQNWMQNRQKKNSDPFYQDMLWDSRETLAFVLSDWLSFPIEGRVIEIEGKIQAFTFGYPLNQEIFCILYEITNLDIKGLAQFIFRQFCSELLHYSYVNIMDDSYLPNLKAVKLSYRPAACIPSYIAQKYH